MVSGGLLKVAWGGSLKGFRDGFFFECAMC